MVNSAKMERKSFMFFVLTIVMASLIMGINLKENGIVIERGKHFPIVREPLTGKYNISINNAGIEIVLSRDLANEYEGKFLAVYAYKSNDDLFVILKMVINGKIQISAKEEASFEVKLRNGKVESITEAGKDVSFYSILKYAKENNLNYGLQRCLLGKQCAKICPVSAIAEFVADNSQQGRGRIIPRINSASCIKCGLCINRCPTNLIVEK